ncbi:MAG: FAD-binding oxidoreductase [Planctomycetota bacterium]
MSTSSPLPLTAVITPANSSEVVDAVRAAAAGGQAVYPLGGGSAIDYGAWPTLPGIGLSTRGLARILEHNADDMTVTVEAGVTLAELAAVLGARGQRLPLDVPRPEQTTIGGLLATNRIGPRKAAYGAPRDFLLGLRAVDGLGREFRAGAQVVKNAAGLNLPRLLAGSMGTLAVLTEVTLLLRPQPETTAVVLAHMPDWSMAEKLLEQVASSPLLPAAVAVVAGPVLDVAPNSCQRMLPVAVFAFEGLREDVQWMVEHATEICTAAGCEPKPYTDPVQAAGWWQWLCGMEADVQATAPPGQLVRVMQTMATIDKDASLVGHALAGVVDVRTSDALRLELASQWGGNWRHAIRQAGAQPTLLRNPPESGLSAEDIFSHQPAVVALGRAIRERFDPHGILNPGRLPHAVRGAGERAAPAQSALQARSPAPVACNR